MNNNFNDADFNPLFASTAREICERNDTVLSPVSEEVEEGELEYNLVDDYSSLVSPVDLKMEALNAIPKRNESKSEQKLAALMNNTPFASDKTSSTQQVLSSGKSTIDETEHLQMSIDNQMDDQIEGKPLPKLPPSFNLDHPLQTMFSRNPIKIDECELGFTEKSDDLSPQSSMHALPYFVRLKITLGSITNQKWTGNFSKKLLCLRIFFLIYAFGILVLEFLNSPIAAVFSKFNVWSWIIMIVHLVLGIIAYRSRRITFGLSSVGIIIYTIFGTNALVTPIPYLISIIENSPEDLQSWILGLSFNSVGLIVLSFELLYNRINLSYEIAPVIAFFNSAVWGLLFTINWYQYGSIGGAFPSNIIGGVTFCLFFPILCCLIIIQGHKSSRKDQEQ